MICEELKRQGLQLFITVNAQPNGEGDATYLPNHVRFIFTINQFLTRSLHISALILYWK